MILSKYLVHLINVRSALQKDMSVANAKFTLSKYLTNN